jgi:hypothetical protein
MLDNLTEVILDTYDPTGCGGFDPIPLPSPRLLWDYNNSEAWAHRLDRVKAKGALDKVLTLRDLKLRGRRQAVGYEIDEGSFETMANWCEGVDEFGSLLYMVALLD